MAESKLPTAIEVISEPLSKRSVVLRMALMHARHALQMLEKDESHDIDTMATAPVRCVIDNLVFLYDRELLKAVKK